MKVLSRQSRRTRFASRVAGTFLPLPVRLIGAATMVALSAVACSSSGTTTAGTPRPGPNLITAAEIEKASVQNAFEAVQKLRPAMLRRSSLASANAQSKGELVVYVDNTRYGPVDNLRQIPASSIAAVRYYSASESQMKWGSNHPGGVIEVLTKR